VCLYSHTHTHTHTPQHFSVGSGILEVENSVDENNISSLVFIVIVPLCVPGVV